MDIRTDLYTAAKLDFALVVAAMDGAHAAAKGLYNEGVPLELAVRVLLKPWLRRPTSARPEPSWHDVRRIQRTGAAFR